MIKGINYLGSILLLTLIACSNHKNKPVEQINDDLFKRWV